MVPLSVMPAWLRAASRASPVAWGAEALEGASWRGATWSELLPLWGLLVGVGLVTFAAGAIRARGAVMRA